MIDDVNVLAEAILNDAKTWADSSDTYRAEDFFYIAGEAVTTMYEILDLAKEQDRLIPDEYLDVLIQWRDEDYFMPEFWEDEQLLKLLPWFEQKRAERDAAN